jgi:flagellar biosynthesis GTPase FlhF
MRIKKFEAVTLQEALAKIKKDFGPEAVILHTKKFKRGGIFGLFGRETTEVTAGIDINIDRPRQQQPQQQQQPAQYEKPSPQIPSLSTQFGGKIQPTAVRQQPAQPRLEPMGHVYNRVEDISMKNDTLARELSEGKVSLSGTLRPSRDNSGSSMQGPAYRKCL